MPAASSSCSTSSSASRRPRATCDAQCPRGSELAVDRDEKSDHVERRTSAIRFEAVGRSSSTSIVWRPMSCIEPRQSRTTSDAWGERSKAGRRAVARRCSASAGSRARRGQRSAASSPRAALRRTWLFQNGGPRAGARAESCPGPAHDMVRAPRKEGAPRLPGDVPPQDPGRRSVEARVRRGHRRSLEDHDDDDKGFRTRQHHRRPNRHNRRGLGTLPLVSSAEGEIARAATVAVGTLESSASAIAS